MNLNNLVIIKVPQKTKKLVNGEGKTNQNQAQQGSEGNESKESKSSENEIDIPKTANIAGIALFRENKLVGEIRNEEIISQLMLQGDLKEVNIDIPDFEDKEKTIVIRLLQKQDPTIDIKIKNGKPILNVTVKLHCNLITSGTPINYTEEENTKKLSNAIKEKLSKDMKSYLDKIFKKYKVDPVGFGKHLRATVTTLDELEKIDWPKILPQTEYDVDFKLHLDTTQMISNQLGKDQKPKQTSF